MCKQKEAFYIVIKGEEWLNVYVCFQINLTVIEGFKKFVSKKKKKFYYSFLFFLTFLEYFILEHTELLI